MEKSLYGISIIIPTFNRMEFLYSTLLCLSNQKLEKDVEYEIVIIDSGNDNTSQMIKSLQKVGRVNVVYKKIKKCNNRSLLRNIGVKYAKFSIICFLDNDMLVSPDFIQTHFNIHKSRENHVVVGARRFLLEFNVKEFGEQTLLHNFNKLAELSWYNDERLNDNISIQPWRFIYSHTLSMKKDTFYKVGGFNISYGNHWGFEDVELGVRLQQNKCTFDFITSSFNYHQPHYKQSLAEQKDKYHNERLMMKTHNEYEVELQKSFYNNFEELYSSLNLQEKNFIVPPVKQQREFDKILGCLFSLDDIKTVHKNMQLGLYCMEKDNSYKKCLIVESFFNFPEIIQISILSQAFRLAYRVYFNKLSFEKEILLLKVAEKAGLIIRKFNDENYSVFGKEWTLNSKLFLVQLPDIYQPEKRYFYKWLLSELLSKDYHVKIMDVRGVRNYLREDLFINDDSKSILELGYNRIQFIGSSSVLMTNMKYAFPKDKSSFIFEDDDFLINDICVKKRRLNGTSYFDEKVYNYLTILSVNHIANKIRNESVEHNCNSYCTFMENGFYEDGIDLVLEAFGKIVQENNNAILTIKTQDYKILYNEIYPTHNDSSKKNKIYSTELKFYNDDILLNKKITELNLEKNIVILKNNSSMFEVGKLINQTEKLLHFSRMISLSPELILAILLKKNVFIGEHVKLINELKCFCIHIKSTEVPFSNEIKVPISCLNSNYSAFKIDLQDFINKVGYEQKLLDDETENKIMNKAKRVFNEIF